MPSLLAREALEFVEQSISPNWNSKKYAFNNRHSQYSR
jgi:hypothetical protein